MSTTIARSHCHHIMDSGRPCGTPPLKGQPFCYYHRRLHADFILPGHPKYIPPILEDRHSVQLALNHVYPALSKSLLDRKLANTMLYNLQLVQSNLGKDGLPPASDAVDEINPAMKHALHLDYDLQNKDVRYADQNTLRSTDTAPRCPPLPFGINSPVYCMPETELDPQRAIERSNRIAQLKVSTSDVPEFCPEIDIEDWQRITRDLPPKGEPGTAQQQANARRVLQAFTHDAQARRMAGIK